MTNDLVDRFAARWGADAAGMKKNPESHTYFPITGGAGRNADVYAGEVEAIRLQFNGRWGNYVFQLMNLFHAAEVLGAESVFLIPTDVFPIQPITINGISIWPDTEDADPAAYCLSGVFFWLGPLGRIMDGLTPERRVYLIETYIRPLMVPLAPPDFIGPGDLVIHIRSGDIFEGEEGYGGANVGGSLYTQPPLSFYLLAVQRVFAKLLGRIVVIAENSLNPVILPLVKTLDEAGHSVTLRLNHDLVTDLSWMFGAGHVVFANGSIGIAAALLSPSIRQAYFFRHNGTGTLEPVSKYIGSQIEKYFVTDDDESFIPFGGWKNTAEQRREMLEFPIEKLQWDDFPAPSKNLALNMPAAQSSESMWSNPNDAQGGNNGRKTGDYGFHTETEPEPWWQVDLTREQPIREVRIFNRLDTCSERARSLRVLISPDGQEWRMVHDQDGQAFGGIDGRPLRVFLSNISARFIRLQLAEENSLHLDEIEIY